jgi:hypothetical protein
VSPAEIERKKPQNDARQQPAKAQPARAAVFSFLKDTRGVVSWTAGDLAETLGVSVVAANDALPILEMQGYVKRSENGEWLTTIAGENFSGSVTPRYEKKSVEAALKGLGERIELLNKDRSVNVVIMGAVAFGDFLSDRARVQAADVGIKFEARGRTSDAGLDKRAREALFSRLRAKSPMLHLQKYEEWMKQRTHRELV